MITNIQRFSLNDGPGIRTTVFFKGCNLSCKWCHNPETLSLTPQLLVYPDKCMGCGACMQVCPKGALQVVEGKITLDRKLCDNCGKCTGVCFSGTLEMAGTEMSVSDMMWEIEQDIPYYNRSGGGVTLSGGEVLLQPELARELLKACKEKGIHTAIETNLCYDFGVLEYLAPYLDLIMADINVYDNDLHKEMTGQGNDLIFDNVRRLDELDIPYILRTPVIPGVNDNEKEISALSRLAGEGKNLLYYELLNFNPLGGSKYDGLDMENHFYEARPLPEARLEDLKNIALQNCASVRVG